MKGELVTFDNGSSLIKAPVGGAFQVVHMDAAQHVAMTVRVSERYLNHGLAPIPRKGYSKLVQVWTRLATCDLFALRFEIPFSSISNMYKLLGGAK